MTSNQELEYIISLFDYENKNDYEYKNDGIKKMNNETHTTIISGVNKKDNSDFINIRAIDISAKKAKEVDYLTQILKFIIILGSLTDQTYFPNSKILLSKNQEYLFIYNKGNNIPLYYLIYSQKTDYLNNKELIRWIVFQISAGLYILHSNNIIHHDLKTSNILINEEGGVLINGFDSSILKGEKSISYTLSYSSPELLINLEADEKIDLWDLGILMLELFCKKHKILENEKIKTRDEYIRYVLSYFGNNEKYSIDDLKRLLKENKDIKFTLDKEILKAIDDKDAIDLISNLLVFNPNKRYSAKEVLESNYLKEFKGYSLEIKPLENPIDYKEISKGSIDHTRFIDLINKLIK